MEEGNDAIISMTTSEFNAKKEEAVKNAVQIAVQAALKNLSLGETKTDNKSVEVVGDNNTDKEVTAATTEPAGFKEEWAEMRKFFQDQKRKDKRISCSDLSLMPEINLPKEFKMPEFVKFDGTGDPVVHLKQYVGALKMAKLDEKAVTHLFPYALTGAAARWYYTLKDEDVGRWSELSQKFLDQYAYNSEIDLTRRDLEETRQEEGETFAAFMQRWRGKASKMVNRPNDQEQNKMILDNLTDKYYRYMFNQSTNVTCAEFYERGVQCDEGFKKGRLKEPYHNNNNGWKRNDYNNRGNNNKNSSESSKSSGNTENKTVNLVRRSFMPKFDMPLKDILQRLMKKNLLTPLQPRGPPAHPPRDTIRTRSVRFIKAWDMTLTNALDSHTKFKT